MTHFISRSLVLAAALCCGTAHAQLAVSLELSKNQYLSGEPVIATVSITNHAGRDIEFQGYLQRPWLDFALTNSRGEPVTPTGAGIFGKVKLGAGQTLNRQVNLSSMFQLTDQGNYGVSATVRMPGVDADTTVSNRVIYTVSPGRPYWSQKVGAGRAGKLREFRLLDFSGDLKSQLYVQVLDGRTGLPVRTFTLGEVLLVRKPSATVDRRQRMHVLFLATPSAWLHCQIDTDGRLVSRDIHKRGPSGDPYLVTSAKGEVTVGNSVLYDPKAAAAKRAKFRKLSERPAITY
ncbi:MAG: hypothetical protein K9N23_13170 [Akkermansiaceae bacterium]|nr:hypothetical protein [Akkermansiaceae bacterium]